MIFVDFQKLNKIFTTDFNIDGVSSVHRSWDADTRYNYLENPRRRSGFMLLTEHPAVFEMADGSVLQGNAGDVMLLPKGARYVVRFLVPVGKMTHPVVLNFRLSTADGEEIGLGSKAVRLCRDEGTLLPLFSATIQLYKSSTPAHLKAKTYELIGNMFPLHEADQCCINYINRHYTRRFSIPELAKKCTLSESAYRKQFKELTGLSPVQYINQLKIEKACQMLLGGDMRVQDISDFLGFYSLPYFYKVFKDCTGLTPKQYLQCKI